jgi:hypothetical protein
MRKTYLTAKARLTAQTKTLCCKRRICEVVKFVERGERGGGRTYFPLVTHSLTHCRRVRLLNVESAIFGLISMRSPTMTIDTTDDAVPRYSVGALRRKGKRTTDFGKPKGSLKMGTRANTTAKACCVEWKEVRKRVRKTDAPGSTCMYCTFLLKSN